MPLHLFDVNAFTLLHSYSLCLDLYAIVRKKQMERNMEPVIVPYFCNFFPLSSHCCCNVEPYLRLNVTSGVTCKSVRCYDLSSVEKQLWPMWRHWGPNLTGCQCHQIMFIWFIWFWGALNTFHTIFFVPAMEHVFLNILSRYSQSDPNKITFSTPHTLFSLSSNN